MNKEINKFRMTYEKAGELYNAYKKDVSVFSDLGLQIICIGLKKPMGTFFEFIEDNSDRLQLFDQEPITTAIYFGNDEDGDLIICNACIYESDLPF
jgi:hypothetical protein